MKSKLSEYSPTSNAQSKHYSLFYYFQLHVSAYKDIVRCSARLKEYIYTVYMESRYRNLIALQPRNFSLKNSCTYGFGGQKMFRDLDST